MSRARGLLAAAPTLLRVGALAAVDRVRPPRDLATDLEWMTDALCRDEPGARVVGVTPDGGHSGTTTRLRLRIAYNDAGTAAGLPATVFTKSSPSLQQRLTQAVTGPVEALFYLRLRPQLTLEAPVCFGGVVDDRRMTALTVMEDLVATKQAQFLSPTTHVDREMAGEIVCALATLHGTFAFASQPGYLKTYVRTWSDAFDLMNIERYFLRCFEEAGELLDPSVRREPARAWRAVLASIDLHRTLAPTVIHNDVHLGNWYRTGAGRMGLTDWQAVARGHWSRDLAYALTTTLTVADRRAWEHALVAEYADALAAAGGPAVSADEAFARYRQQTWGALAFWAPTYSPPRLMPADMQPRSVSGELLTRISTACADLDAFTAVGV